MKKNILSIIFCGMVLLICTTGCVDLFFKRVDNEHSSEKIPFNEEEYNEVDNVTTTTTTKKTTTTKENYKLTLNQKYVNEDTTGGSDYTFKANNEFDAHAWAKDAGGTAYHGIYKIEGKTLTATITEYQDVTGEWEKLPESEINPQTYTLTSDSSFVNEKGETWNLK